mmetsp:Transcript_46600/g.116088  ORF Transcript_46600/g.116088 Transcript_46600/m.116088 type:complete len:87 (+) Transcript_46600:840-1100(+)
MHSRLCACFVSSTLLSPLFSLSLSLSFNLSDRTLSVCVLNESIRLDGSIANLSLQSLPLLFGACCACIPVNSPREWAHGPTDGRTE